MVTAVTDTNITVTNGRFIPCASETEIDLAVPQTEYPYLFTKLNPHKDLIRAGLKKAETVNV